MSGAFAYPGIRMISKTVIPFPNSAKTITSLVMDESEFNDLCDRLRGIQTHDGATADDTMIAKIREAKHLPMITKGLKTNVIFDHYGIETDMACFIVRGMAEQLAANMGMTTDQAMERMQLMLGQKIFQSPDKGVIKLEAEFAKSYMNAIYDLMPPASQKSVDDITAMVLSEIKNPGTGLTNVVTFWVKRNGNSNSRTREEFVQSTIISIATTLKSFIEVGETESSDVFADYIKRLFTTIKFDLDTGAAKDLPSYIKNNPKSRDVLTPVLAIVDTTYDSWAGQYKATSGELLN
jgi:hypothetical protein